MDDKTNQVLDRPISQPTELKLKVESSHSRVLPIVGIGASAGGLEAITELLQSLPIDSGFAFVVIQHLDPTHESILADLLARATKMPVQQVKEGMKVEENHVYVVPPNVNMSLKKESFELIPREESRGLHMPIDYFFRSLAQNHDHQSIAIILSGTGSDGALGLKDVKENGGITFVQDIKSAKFSGMPQSAISTGAVDFTLCVEDIAQELARIAHHPYVTSSRLHHGSDKTAPLRSADKDYLGQVFQLLRGATGTDFSYYKHTTIQRRITRRMTLQKVDSLKDYVALLKKHPDELKALYRDLLIKVTSFFRDPETFEELQKVVIPRILENGHSSKNPVRIWVPGCATGEEVYSIAICFAEYIQEKKSDASFHIFATDIDEVSLQQARKGLYIENIALDVSAERLERYFSKLHQYYRINKSIRETCTFAKHDLGKDPPFSNLDLISCRNVMIYFDPTLQKRIIPIFHYALKPSGFLTLGTAETIGSFSNLFETVDKKQRIFAKKLASIEHMVDFVPHQPRSVQMDWIQGDEPKTEVPWKELDMFKEADQILLNYAPAGVFVNEQMDILQFRGDTSCYIMPAPGKASLNLLRMARPGLLVQIKSAVDEAKKTSAPTSRERILVRCDDKSLNVTVRVVPLKLPSSSPHFLVLFEHSPLPIKRQFKIKSFFRTLFQFDNLQNGNSSGLTNEVENQEMNQLRQELGATKQYLQSIIESQDSTNEELKSANEEILSSNEELQSTNEELETAKEELQSTNEELTTVNEEVQNRNQELSQANNDLNNLFSSANLPIVMLGDDLRIRRFTPAAVRALNILPTDIGRPLEHLRLNIHVPDLHPMLISCIKSGNTEEREVQDRQGHWYTARIRPYKTTEDKIEGALIFFIDIESIKGVEKLNQALKELRKARTYNEWVVETIREPLLILDNSFHVISANPAFYKTFETSKEETEKQLVYNLGNGQWNSPQLHQLLEKILPESTEFNDFEINHEFPKIGQRTMSLNARRLDGQDQILLAIEDITKRKLIEAQIQNLNTSLEQKVVRRTMELSSSNKELESFCYSVAHDLRTPLRSIVSYSQIIKRNWKEELAPDAQKYLELTIDAGKHMANLIDHLLDLSRVTRKQMIRETIDLSSEAEAIAGELRNREPGRQVEFHITPGLSAQGDRELMRLVLQNLIDNAWKFTSKVPHAVIDFGKTSEDKREVFFVRDNGIGFDMVYASKLFTLFQRLHEEKDFPGLGIGLATVQRIIHRYGGEIWVDSEKNLGTTFYFTLKKD